MNDVQVLEVPPSISSGFIERYVWPQPRLCKEIQSMQWKFDEEMLADIQLSLSYAFRCGRLDPQSQKAIYLSSPHQGGHSVVDAVVKHLAVREQADVLVIDALELAAGRLGLLADGVLSFSFWSQYLCSCSSCIHLLSSRWRSD